MNKKLEDYRDDEAFKEYAQPFGMPKDPVDGEYAYKTGFNLAIALELPVKFAQWKKDYPFDMKNRVLWMDIVAKVGHNSPSIPELYTYYIENVWDIKK